MDEEENRGTIPEDSSDFLVAVSVLPHVPKRLTRDVRKRNRNSAAGAIFEIHPN